MDPLAQFDVVIPTFQRLASNTGAEQLDVQTPCEKWKVRDLFEHIIVGATTFAAIARGDEPPSSVDAGPDPERPARANAALDDINAAFRTPGVLENIAATPFGEMPGEIFARLLAFDLLTHTWDLATSTGQSVDVPDAVVAEVDGFARAALAPEMRGPETFGPEVEAAAGASPLERLAAFAGRQP